MSSTRLSCDPLGKRYPARKVPRELSGGEATQLKAIAFETDMGPCVGSVSVDHTVELEDLKL